MNVKFDAMSLSRAGGREVNEDYVDAVHTADASCWVIADGLGGHRGGAIASKLVVETALRSFQEHPQVSAEQVERHVEQAQEALLAAQRSDASLAQMRSTIVVLVANDREAVWGHVGDTRLYHLRGGRVVSRTRDHSVSQALVDGGQIDHRQQGVHEDRSRLLRSLGKDGEPARPTIGGPEPLCRDDAFLLCTDGFWEGLDETAVEIDYAGSEDAAAWLDRLDARLRAQDLPLKDNLTAACVRVVSSAAPAPPPHDPRRAASAAAANGAATPGAGGSRPRQSAGSMAAAAGVMSAPAATAASEAVRESGAGATTGDQGRRSLFGAYRGMLLRLLYASMAIVLAALLYTAWLAYADYVAHRGGTKDGSSGNGSPRTDDPLSNGASGGMHDPKKATPAAPHDSRVSARPVTPDPGTNSAPSLGATGSLSGPAPAENVHYAGPGDVPGGKVFRPAQNRAYPSLQAALAEAGPVETIWLGPGEYSDELPPITNDITFKGAGRDRTSLSLTGAAGLVLTGKGGGLEDLAITAAAGPAVVEIGGSFRGTIRHVRIHDGTGLGLLIRDHASPAIADTVYENNRGGNYLARDDAKPRMQ